MAHAHQYATFDPANPETIKGAKVGITAPGSSSDFFVRYYLQRHGLSESDVSLIGVGSGGTAVAALQEGKIDLLVNYDPAATIITERGIGEILIDARSDEGAEAIYGGIYPTSVLYATQDFIDENPEIIQKVTDATVEALQWMHDHSPEEIVEVLPQEFVTGDQETYVKAVQNAMAIFSPDGMIDPNTITTPLEVLKTFNENVANTEIDLSKTYTDAFVEKARAEVTQ